jgi:hypothetical protein
MATHLKAGALCQVVTSDRTSRRQQGRMAVMMPLRQYYSTFENSGSAGLHTSPEEQSPKTHSTAGPSLGPEAQNALSCNSTDPHKGGYAATTQCRLSAERQALFVQQLRD